MEKSHLWQYKPVAALMIYPSEFQAYVPTRIRLLIFLRAAFADRIAR